MKTIIIILITVLMFGCSTTDNEKKAVEWMNSATKPIYCFKYSRAVYGNAYTYTLIDAKGNVFVTGAVKMTLPDTIHSTH